MLHRSTKRGSEEHEEVIQEDTEDIFLKAQDAFHGHPRRRGAGCVRKNKGEQGDCMFLAEVRGNVVATTKNEKLMGKKLLIVQPLSPQFEPRGETLIAVDTVGAGEGERVIIAKGGSARVLFPENTPVDAAIVGIIDSLEYR